MGEYDAKILEMTTANNESFNLKQNPINATFVKRTLMPPFDEDNNKDCEFELLKGEDILQPFKRFNDFAQKHMKKHLRNKNYTYIPSIWIKSNDVRNTCMKESALEALMIIIFAIVILLGAIALALWIKRKVMVMTNIEPILPPGLEDSFCKNNYNGNNNDIIKNHYEGSDDDCIPFANKKFLLITSTNEQANSNMVSNTLSSLCELQQAEAMDNHDETNNHSEETASTASTDESLLVQANENIWPDLEMEQDLPKQNDKPQPTLIDYQMPANFMPSSNYVLESALLGNQTNPNAIIMPTQDKLQNQITPNNYILSFNNIMNRNAGYQTPAIFMKSNEHDQTEQIVNE